MSRLKVIPLIDNIALCEICYGLYQLRYIDTQKEARISDHPGLYDAMIAAFERMHEKPEQLEFAL